MQVYEIRTKIFLLKNVMQEEAQSYIAEFIDGALCSDSKWQEFHKINCFKGYSFNSLWPVEKTKIYQKEKVYTFIIRTVNAQLGEFLTKQLPHRETQVMKGLVSELNKIHKGYISTLYSLTPVIVKGKENGYWKESLSFDEYQDRIKINLIKAHNQLEHTKMDEDFVLWNLFEITNHKPIAIPYKNIKLLADKIQVEVADNKNAQKLAYLALAVGLGEMGARGSGYVNYHMIRG